MGGGKGSAPDAPDYMALADKSANSALNLAQYNVKANRVNQTNPYGSVRFSQNADGTWNQNSALSPQQQDIFNRQQGAVQNAYGNANGVLSNPTIDLSALPQAPIHAGMTAQDAIMSRLQPQIDRQRSQVETQLQDQRFNPSSEGYHNAMTDQSQRENDLLNQAALTGINADMAARQQGLGEQQAAINTPINAINALKGGQQTGLPSAGIAQQALTQPADYLGAAQNGYEAAMQKYNVKQQQNNDMWGSLAGMGSMLLMSDARLKKDVKPHGKLPSGIPVYTFRYLWEGTDIQPHVGVMAQEVRPIIPHAVIDVGGYMAVDYGALH